MAKRMRKMFIILFSIVIIIVCYRKFVIDYFMGQYFIAMGKAPTFVNASTAQQALWHDNFAAVGTLVAENGVDVTSQVPGMISQIYFASGQHVKKGDIILQLDDRTDQQDLKNYQAQQQLAQSTYQRNISLLQKHFISQSDLDKSRATLDSAMAMTQKTADIISQKTISAPFDCQLGIRQVNVGQFVQPGTPFVNCQDAELMFADFSLPAQDLAKLKVGEKINLQVDAYPEVTFTGTITAMSSQVNVKTRNIAIRAAIPNPKNELFPGMFATIVVIANDTHPVITVPQTAVTFNLYGDSVYVINNTSHDPKKPEYHITLRQVISGERRDNLVAIDKGLTAGEMVVTSGQNKLHNDMIVQIDNSVDITKMNAHETLY